jgi:hypothetical protein
MISPAQSSYLGIEILGDGPPEPDLFVHFAFILSRQRCLSLDMTAPHVPSRDGI